MEHSFRCKICYHREAWDSPRSCELAAAHHVYKAHPAEFATLEIEVPTERAEDFGQRFEQWELQS